MSTMILKKESGEKGQRGKFFIAYTSGHHTESGESFQSYGNKIFSVSSSVTSHLYIAAIDDRVRYVFSSYENDPKIVKNGLQGYVLDFLIDMEKRKDQKDIFRDLEFFIMAWNRAYFFKNYQLLEIKYNSFKAIGSGSMAARAILLNGKKNKQEISLEQCLETICEVDLYSSGDIKTVHIEMEEPYDDNDQGEVIFGEFRGFGKYD